MGMGLPKIWELIPEATHRETVNLIVVVPVGIAIEEIQGAGPSVGGTELSRTPPVTVVANAVK